MAFIFLRTDAFLNNLRLNREKGGADLIKDKENLPNQRRPIRRPYRGIQIKEDRYSTLSVLEPGNKPVPLISSSSTRGTAESRAGRVREYADYILQAISEQRTEKQQIIETFGDPFVYFFGERPRIVEVRGLLINTEDFNWKSQFWKNYDEFLRGTKLVQRNARAYLSWDTTIIEGYILQASASEAAEMPYSVPFTFSMLVTGHYDWSDVGQTKFPGYDKQLKSLDVLNRELEDRRSHFTSTAAEVRIKNLTAQPSGGFGAFVKSSIRDVNSVISTAGSLVDRIGNVVGGRTVRVPLGIAGFLQSTGAARIGVGSITTNRSTAEALGKQFDAATGTFEGINGSVKLRMPGAAVFAPAWTSSITGTGRGYIFENLDEYPTEDSPPTLRHLLSLDNFIDVLNRRLNRQMAIEESDRNLAMHTQLDGAGGILGDLADAVAFAKGAFGMAMTAAAFARDPLEGLKATLGIQEIGGDVSQSRIEGRRDQLEKQGIKTAFEDKSFLQRVGNFIGGSALRTFEAVATGEAQNPEPASVGRAYTSDAAYVLAAVETAGAEGLSYENAYGSDNYNSLVGTEPGSKDTLEEVYGNTDTESDLDPSSLASVYGSGSLAPATRTSAEIAAILASIQSGAPDDADEDRSGIRGVGDEDAPIDPII
jgi:hypothetical protein